MLLTPGVSNSAYFEHTFLAQQMGIELVEGRDLLIARQCGLYAHHRRICAASTSSIAASTMISSTHSASVRDSILGVPGLFNAYRAGNVTLANAIGTGVADDKAVYAYVPEIIRYLLERRSRFCRTSPHFPDGRRNAPPARPQRISKTWSSKRSANPADMACSSARTAPRSSARIFARAFLPNRATTSRSPRSRSLARPASSTAAVESRHIDLRPYILMGEKVTLVPGGLTRVALRKGSLVVNSSQGGGSKDTWVLREGAIGDDILRKSAKSLRSFNSDAAQRFSRPDRTA